MKDRVFAAMNHVISPCNIDSSCFKCYLALNFKYINYVYVL